MNEYNALILQNPSKLYFCLVLYYIVIKTTSKVSNAVCSYGSIGILKNVYNHFYGQGFALIYYLGEVFSRFTFQGVSVGPFEKM